ncbi:armadillo-type protein [Crepidotus variabilis]|uniref:Armadillo-type protein n=1 Tax=Crepidotus variabilis TaxID=179855 RepID=A0A9P6E3E5_9AGAR|nr:armadillo-type protein [Crepidotus variabilis]
MESVVPPQITAELTQILSNLVLGDNEIRSNAEKAVNERLTATPELYLLALSQFAITADTEVMRSFSLVLLRRLLFRPAPGTTPTPAPPTARTTLYDHLSHQTLATLERLLLFSLSHETSANVRRKCVDTICDLANQGMLRGRPWHALQAQAFSMTHAQSSERGETAPGLRETAYRVFAGCPNLVMDLQVDAVLGVFQRGLQDQESVEVRHAALLASVAYLSAADAAQVAQSMSLMSPMLETLYTLSNSLAQPAMGTTAHSNSYYLSAFLSDLTTLCSSHPLLFAPHLQSLLSFLPSIILPALDCGPTPTVGRPFPNSGSSSRQGSFVFPPPSSSTTPDTQDEDEERDERSTLRLSALEFMISLTESRPSMVKKVSGWTETIVRACLEGMGEFDEDESLDSWLKDDPSSNASPADTDSAPALYEQAIDRLACALGGRSVLPPAFQYIPSMMASYDWRVRHAGLMAIAAIGEGTGRVMQKELGKVVDLVIPMFADSNPRVRYAACQCVGQLCTDLEEIIQRRYHQQLFTVLIPSLDDPEPRVHAHAAAALINFCEGVEREILLPYLDPIVERLLKLLNPSADPSNAKRYVQEQAITTLAMVADASEVTFGKHYPTIMPLLINVLRNAEGEDYQKLRVKAMECAGLIAIAVGPEVFRPDSQALVELLMRIQQSPTEPSDTQLSHYLIATWAKVCQALGSEFEPYLPVVMPSLLSTASAKADLSLYGDEESSDDKDGWETIVMDGQTYGIKTSSMEEKCQAFETLVIYCSTLGPRFAPYLSQTLEVTLPCLKFYFHEGVREACAMLIPMLLLCGKDSGTLTNQMVSATFQQLINSISSEQDATFLASLYKYFTETVRVLGGPETLSPQFSEGVMEATKRQLTSLADKRKSRAAKAQSLSSADFDREDLALVEEIEDYALEDMAKMLVTFDPNHTLLVAVSSVRDLGFNTYDSDEEEGSEAL